MLLLFMKVIKAGKWLLPDSKWLLPDRDELAVPSVAWNKSGFWMTVSQSRSYGVAVTRGFRDAVHREPAYTAYRRLAKRGASMLTSMHPGRTQWEANHAEKNRHNRGEEYRLSRAKARRTRRGMTTRIGVRI
jgi:hypothetical protein